MIISEKQINKLLNIARIVTLEKLGSDEFIVAVRNLIEEIENQQSDELIQFNK